MEILLMDLQLPLGRLKKAIPQRFIRFLSEREVFFQAETSEQQGLATPS
jgi:hypothetical protein